MTDHATTHSIETDSVNLDLSTTTAPGPLSRTGRENVVGVVNELADGPTATHQR